MNKEQINSLALAYIGDSVYELYVRKYLIEKKIIKVNDLQKEAVKYVSAKAQASYLKMMLNDNFLNDDELIIINRARNHKVNSHPKNTDIITYKYATGLEALIGYLYIDDNHKRIDEIMHYIFKQKNI